MCDSLYLFFVSQCFSATASIFFLLVLLIRLSFHEKRTFINKTIDIIELFPAFYYHAYSIKSFLNFYLELFFGSFVHQI